MQEEVSRREAVGMVLAAGAGVAALSTSRCLADIGRADAVIRRRIPSTEEELPVVGIGTKRVLFGVTDPAEVEVRHKVLQAMLDHGGRVIDTAAHYGSSQEVIGEFIDKYHVRDRVFIATKTVAQNNDLKSGIQMTEDSFSRLRCDRIDLLQVHSLVGVQVLLPFLRELKHQGRIRYYGVTTSSDVHHDAIVELMRNERLDFVQVNYSLAFRNAATRLLPTAHEFGVAVLANVPFLSPSGSMFKRVAGQKLPPWATEINVSSWGQFFLKYIIARPHVTCVIPGTGKLWQIVDNMGAARGELPSASMRQKMERLWDALS